MLPLDDALRIVDESLAGVTLPGETVAVRAAVGRILAADQFSRLDLPPFDKSAMDGYAVATGDERATYRVVETVPAGNMPSARLEPGTAVKVMTGAPVPAGTGRVIQVEHVEPTGETIRVVQPSCDTHICSQGEDVRCGDCVLSAGTRLGPLEVANLIGCGIIEVAVYRPVRLAIFSTGDEIVDDPGDLRPGRIMNTNKPLLVGLAARFGMDVVRTETVRDDLAATVTALRSALQQADIVVLSGGVSVGDFDFVGQAMEQAGLCVHFSAVAVKPGRPTTYASGVGGVTKGMVPVSSAETRDSPQNETGDSPHAVAVFGLPGNPVSVYLDFHLFVLRAAARMTRSGPPLHEFSLPLGCDFRRRKAERAEYVPCRIGDDGTLQRIEFHGSAHLLALCAADGFFVVPAGVQTLAAGTSVPFCLVGYASA